jgi:serine/threonine protein kinase
MEQIGKYAIVGQIGTGGFGVVYEGRDPFLKRRVAIKTCSSEESDIRDRFFREAEIAGNLQHRNIVTVHDFGVQDGVPYLVQEYLTGEDLDRVVARREPLTPAQRVDILVQAAHGLAYAHARGVIHRDIKPANIRLTAEGIVRIMDFGIAKLSNVASHLTRTGMTLGTAAYLPPEQIRGTAVDHRADVFSFGVTAYELLTYHRPFAGKTISALFWELLQREPEPPSHHWPLCPPALEAIVLRCLAKDPNQRYSGFDELIPHLEAVLADLERPGRGEEKTAPHPRAEPAPRPHPVPAPAPTQAQPRPTEPRPAPLAPTPQAAPSPQSAAGTPGPQSAPPPPRPRANERFEAAVTAVRRLRPPETGGLLGEVEEALAGARAAAFARRARELLARGDLEGAERELESVPEKAGADIVALRRDIARARTDRLLAQAAARWQQGEPQPALELLEQLLAIAPDHQDALGLRAAWRAEIAERERVRVEAETRRSAIAKAVVEAETLLTRGDVDGAEAVIAAAQAHLGSHQPLRDLRRRISLARSSAPVATVAPPRGFLDASTVGVQAGSVEAARQRVEAAERGEREGGAGAAARTAAPPPAVSPSWPRPALPPAPAAPPPSPPQAASSPTFGGGEGALGADRIRLILLVVGAVLVLLVLALLARWVMTRGSTARATATPTPVAAPSGPFGAGLPAASPMVPAAPAVPDRDAALLSHPPAAFPRGVPRRPTVVRIEVLVSASGAPLQTRIPAGPPQDPRLVAEARRVAGLSRYAHAIRGGAPAEAWTTVDVSFQPPP